MSKLIKSTIIYTLGELIPKLLSFAFLPIFTAYLTSSDYGIMSYTNSIMIFLYVFACLSLNSFLLRKYYEFKTEYQRKKLIGNIAIAITFFNLLILAIAFLIGPMISQKANIKIDFYPYFTLSLINNFIEVFAIVPLVIFRIMEKPTQYVLLNIGRGILPYFIIYYMLVHLNMGLLSFYYGKLFINIIFLIPLIYITYKHAIFDISIPLLKEGLKFSLPLLPGAIAYLLMSISDRIIMERYISLSLIGIYSIAYTLAFSLSMFIQSGYRAFEPEIFKKFNDDNFSLFIEGLHRIFMFIVFSMAITLSVFSKELLQILTTGDFVNGYTLIPILILGVILTAENAILGSIAIAEKKTKLSMYSTLAGAIFSVTINIILLPLIGYYSAAIATVVSFLVMNVIIYIGLDYKLNAIKFDLMAYFTYLTMSLISILFIVRLSLGISANYCIKLIIIALSVWILSRSFNINYQQIKKTITIPLSKYLPNR